MVSSPTPDGRQISKAQGRRPRTAPCAFFERLYVFLMVIYMAQMTPEAGRMVGRLSGDPVPLLVPIVMTLVPAGRALSTGTTLMIPTPIGIDAATCP